MDKLITSMVRVDLETAARIEKRAGETGLTPEEFVATLVRENDNGVQLDQAEIDDLHARWAEVEAGAELIPHEEVRRWLKTWGTPDFKPWPDSR